MNTSADAFGKDASLKLKGIAIIMMLLHHYFRSAEAYTGYTIATFPLKEQQLLNIATACKICVSIFAFITGYGLYISYKNNRKSAQNWAVKRYIKMISGYWFAWCICAMFSQFKDGRVAKTLFKEGCYKGVLYSLLNFLGVSNLFGTPSIDYRWWYMSAAVVFVFLTPFVYKHKNNLILILIAAVLFIRVLFVQLEAPVTLGGQCVYAFLAAYITGAIFARYNILDRWVSVGHGNGRIKAVKFVISACVVIILYKFYMHIPGERFWELHFCVFPVAVIIFLIEFILPLKFLDKPLKILGRHSMNIYYTHSVLQWYYADLAYSCKHFTVSIVIILGILLGLSTVIELTKKQIKYEKLIGKLLAKLS